MGDEEASTACTQPLTKLREAKMTTTVMALADKLQELKITKISNEEWRLLIAILTQEKGS